MSLLAFGGIGYVFFAGPRGSGGGERSFQTVEVDRATIAQTVRATGRLNPLRKVQVGSQISGMIAEIHADFNSPVREGELIARLDTATFEANVRLAEAELESARAALHLARANHHRQAELAGHELLAAADLETAAAELAQREAAMRIRESQLEMARLQLARCSIISPTDGIVISRNVDVGQTVAASLSAPVLFEIADNLAEMKINTHVSEADIGRVREGHRVEFRVDAFRDRTFEGYVHQVRNAPIMVDNVVSYDAVVRIDNSDLLLKPGMTAEVFIITDERPNVVRVRNTALRARLPEELLPPEQAQPDAPGTWRPVFVLGQDDRIAQRWVRTGIADDLHTEIHEGVEPGDRLVTGLAVRRAGAPGPRETSSLLGGRQTQF
ncbi:MAG: efflux RND transporter periplasmic adaptor subunit [Opitutales bacterium]|nr:efflux RND transporter periplasmic adaptor subunit [Opitutales bacterium]